MYAKGTQAVNLSLNDAVGETELRNAVFQHAAYLVQRLEDMDIISLLDHIAGKAQSRGAGAYHCHLYAVLRLALWECRHA